jgi:hypothetical protein
MADGHVISVYGSLGTWGRREKERTRLGGKKDRNVLKN